MANLAEFQKRFAKIASREELEKILFEQIKKYRDEALAFNKDKLSKGIDTTGGVLHGDGPYTGYYKPYTEWVSKNFDPKPRKPKRTGERYNMEWTGTLFDEMELLFPNASEAVFHSGAETLDKLIKVGFKDILGFTDEDLKTYISTYIYPAFMLQIRKILLLE